MKIAALVVLALAVAAPPARAGDTVVATVSKPTSIDAYGGRAVWSTWDPAAGAYRLTQYAGGAVRPVPVAPSGAPFDADLGPGPHGGTIAVYSRCARPVISAFQLDGRRGCDLYAYRFATGREVKLTGADSPRADEFFPAVWRGRVAFTRTYRNGRRLLYWRGPSGPSHRLPTPALEGGVPAELDLRGDRVAYEVVEEFGQAIWLSRIGGDARKLVQIPGSGAEVRHEAAQGPTLAGRLVHWALAIGADVPTFTQVRTVDVQTRRNRRATPAIGTTDPLAQQATTGFGWAGGAAWYVRAATRDAFEVHVATGLRYIPARPPAL